MYKRLYFLGFLTYPVLLVLALFFYKERTIFIDVAFLLFNIAKNEELPVQVYRFGAALTQVFPLMGALLSLSLKHISMIYSAVFVLHAAAFYALCGLVFKRYKLGLVLLLTHILFTTHTFYWVASELIQGLSFSIAIFAFLSWLSDKEYKWRWELILTAIGIVTIVFFHPLLLFVFAFFVLFCFTSRETIVHPRILWSTITLFLITFFIKREFFSNYYDAEAMENAKNNLALFPHYFDLYSNKRFLLNCLSIYYWIPILTIVISAVYIKRKWWLKTALFLSFLFGFLLMVNVTYPTDFTKEFYIESMYLPVGFMIALPFVFHVLPLIMQKKFLAQSLLGAIVVSACIRIYLAHGPYTNRLDWERKFLSEHRNEKIIASTTQVPMDTLLMNWGTPYEFWLLSTIETGKAASVVIHDNVEQALSWNSPGNFITTWGPYPYSDLPARYFPLPDTINAYKLIK